MELIPSKILGFNNRKGRGGTDAKVTRYEAIYKGRYGLRALIDLAAFSSEEEAVSIQSISERQNISESYLEQLVRLLKKQVW